MHIYTATRWTLKIKNKKFGFYFKLLMFQSFLLFNTWYFQPPYKVFSKIRPDLGLPWWLGLRLFFSTAGGLVSIPDQGTKILHALRPEKKTRPDCKKIITAFPQSRPTSQVGFFSSVINLSSHLLFITPNKKRIYSPVWGLFLLLFFLVIVV